MQLGKHRFGKVGKGTERQESAGIENHPERYYPCGYWSNVVLSLVFLGGGRRSIKTIVGVSQQIYSLPSLAT